MDRRAFIAASASAVVAKAAAQVSAPLETSPAGRDLKIVLHRADGTSQVIGHMVDLDVDLGPYEVKA